MCQHCEDQHTIGGNLFYQEPSHIGLDSTPFEVKKARAKAVKNAEVYINVAREFARLSKYNGTKVGCVLVKDGNMISHGVNGYPKGVKDEFVNSLERDTRLQFAIHAEENAFLKLIETGQNAIGAVAYMTHFPCLKCAARLYSLGIRRVVMYVQDQEFMEKWIIPSSHLYEILKDMEFIQLKEKK
ncbi:DNA polymerase III epsilon subunit [Agrobacterium phage OLIVR5]|uniref:DNA polymerase III epsilon subunit n=2 Tax=Caudoviricetes TaxID=2731619 RepID=A0A858MSD0_9CAUD|nr:DNA polymerase III epsilon subunit [Agrobacterium phage OLIVR5]QIW87687.1 DNA polymerase III epsilon subunit [Agrobacterium phage OLIVR5]QIW87949.1 DNA polymerase III epsilon subunit [Agrobacterium phage OLIVR6]